MSCYHPLKGWYSASKNSSGKRSIVFNPLNALCPLPSASVNIPCGQCIGCRLDRARSWAIRCMHEARMHDSNCFITLTYNDENLPSKGSLNKVHFQKFLKRLRQSIFRENGDTGLKFYMCGEYGEKLSRPHYHALIFGFDFPDKRIWCVRNGNKFYRSELLESLWKFGYSLIGDATFDTAAYVARYVTKKITGDKADLHYQGKLSEYNIMSRGGKKGKGLGYSFFEKYAGDIYPHDYVPMVGKFVLRPPKYYDDKYDLTNHDLMVSIKEKRREHAMKNILDHKQLEANELYTQLVTKDLKRGVENGQAANF